MLFVFSHFVYKKKIAEDFKAEKTVITLSIAIKNSYEL